MLLDFDNWDEAIAALFAASQALQQRISHCNLTLVIMIKL